MAAGSLDPRFRELSATILASISADEIGLAVVQHVHHRLASGVDEIRALEGLPSGTRAIYATWAVDAEVLNGGFHQFFFHRSDALAGEALAAYELLGAEDYAAVMRAAIATFESERAGLGAHHDAGAPATSGSSQRDTELGALDQRYYALGDGIYHVWATTVRDRPELFEPSGG